MRSRVSDGLRKRAGNTFLWLSIVVKKLQCLEIPSLNDIDQVIQDSPRELDDLYNDLILRALRSDRHAKILAWTINAKEPLDLSAVSDAVSVNPEHMFTRYKDYAQY